MRKVQPLPHLALCSPPLKSSRQTYQEQQMYIFSLPYISLSMIRFRCSTFRIFEISHPCKFHRSTHLSNRPHRCRIWLFSRFQILIMEWLRKKSRDQVALIAFRPAKWYCINQKIQDRRTCGANSSYSTYTFLSRDWIHFHQLVLIIQWDLYVSDNR